MKPLNDIFNRLRSIVTAAGIFAAVPFAYAEGEVIEIWPDGAPHDNGLSDREDRSNPTSIVANSHALLTVYPADSPDGRIVMMCPGGGYTHLAAGHEGHDMAPWFNARGITYAVLEYRMPAGNREIPFEDAEQGMRILKANAQKWGGDPARVGIAGASAGGHLAATVAVLHTDSVSRPAFQILFYPVISMQEGVTHQGSRQNLLGENPDAESVRRYSLQNSVDGDTPPAFIMLSADDTVVPPKNSFDYASALIGNGVPVEMHVYPTGGHGWGFGDYFPYKPQWTMELDAWLGHQ